jgi:hypothetical protein
MDMHATKYSNATIIVMQSKAMACARMVNDIASLDSED